MVSSIPAGPNTYFYNNHPIRFVAVAGLITARTEIPSRTVLTLDDSSGAILDLVVLRQRPDQLARCTNNGDTGIAFATTSGGSGGGAAAAATAEPSQLQQHVSATTKTPLDISRLEAGTLVKAKGTLAAFRGELQLEVERLAVLADTNAEMGFVDQRMRYLVDVLSAPWRLEPDEIEQLRRGAAHDELQLETHRTRLRDKQSRRCRRERRIERELLRRWDAEEVLREKEAAKARDAGRRFMMRVLAARRV